MEIVRANEKDLEAIHQVVSITIEDTYKVCGQKIVDFFHMIHSAKNILRDIRECSTYKIMEEGRCVGTGCVKGNHLTRLYILPEYQGRGFGRVMMDLMEQEVAEHYDEAFLDPSESAIAFYEKRGYSIVSHEDCQLDEGAVLPHDVMKKDLTGFRKDA